MEELIQEARTFFKGGGALPWLAAAAGAVVITLLFKLIIQMASSRLRKVTNRTQSIWDDIAVDLIEGLKGGVIFAWVFYWFTQPLVHSEVLKRSLLAVVVVASMFQLGIWGLHVIKNWRTNILDRRIQQDPSSAAALGLLYTAVQMVFIIIIVLIGLSNLGIDITALIAGLGVGGIAVALAAQNVLGDLLASLSIVLDKPFVVGDFIITGSEKGTVEHIGIKTTRLRSLSGEQLVISNKDILESRVQNFKRMWTRRVVHRFGVLYSTPVELIEQVPGWLKEMILKREKLIFDRCHFSACGASSLEFELVYFVADPDYNTHMDIQQGVLLEILRKFKAEGVEFAYPTQTLHIGTLPAQERERSTGREAASGLD